jgi:hypothetical protein
MSSGLSRDKALWNNRGEDIRWLYCDSILYPIIIVSITILIKLVSVKGLISVLLT